MKAAHHTGGSDAPATFGTREGSATFDAQAGVVTQNKDKTTMAKEMLTRNPAELRPHPLFAKTHHPMMAKDSAEWASLVQSVKENGVYQAVIITEDGEIVDGRHRAAAAVEAGIAEVRVEVVEGWQAPLIIAETLVQRRHFNKSARAYLVAPFAEEATAAGKKARNANLRQNSPNVQKLDVREEGATNTLESFADRMGISREYLVKARDVHARLEKISQKVMVTHPVSGERMTVRERVEDILFNEQGGFQPVLAMLGYLAAGNKAEGQELKDKRAQYGRLAAQKFNALSANFRTWDTCDAVEKEVLYQAIPKEVVQWPLDVAQRLYTALSARRGEWMGKD